MFDSIRFLLAKTMEVYAKTIDTKVDYIIYAKAVLDACWLYMCQQHLVPCLLFLFHPFLNYSAADNRTKQLMFLLCELIFIIPPDRRLSFTYMYACLN